MMLHKGFVTSLMIILLFTNEKKFTVALFGGQDLFTSLAQLEVLWQNDIKVVKQMEETIEKMEKAIGTLKM